QVDKLGRPEVKTAWCLSRLFSLARRIAIGLHVSIFDIMSSGARAFGPVLESIEPQSYRTAAHRTAPHRSEDTSDGTKKSEPLRIVEARNAAAGDIES
ncbi:hypothetical protein RRG08_007174, partial [Elysia crispata]